MLLLTNITSSPLKTKTSLQPVFHIFGFWKLAFCDNPSYVMKLSKYASKKIKTSLHPWLRVIKMLQHACSPSDLWVHWRAEWKFKRWVWICSRPSSIQELLLELRNIIIQYKTERRRCVIHAKWSYKTGVKIKTLSVPDTFKCIAQWKKTWSFDNVVKCLSYSF